MTMLEHLRRMAAYNGWASDRLYAACQELDVEAYFADREAFFGSIHGTLNHLWVGDRVWLDRLRHEPPSQANLAATPFATLDELDAARRDMQEAIANTLAEATEAGIMSTLVYRMVSSPQNEMHAPAYLCWLHLFNHQTRHRGQVHVMISQAGREPPPLDLIFYLRELG